MVENRGTRRQWGILLLLPRCQNKLRSYCLFNSVSSLLLQLLPQEQIGSPSVMTFITYLWVLLITLNVFATHFDFSKRSDNFGQKITKPLVLIQITQTAWTYLLSLKIEEQRHAIVLLCLTNSKTQIEFKQLLPCSTSSDNEDTMKVFGTKENKSIHTSGHDNR